MKGLLLSGGSPPSQELLNKEIKWADKIVCADHGYDMIQSKEIQPDLLVGDFDSIKHQYIPSGLKVETHIAEKDETDTELALEGLLGFGVNKIHILGGLGSRIDHTLGNIFLLEKFLKEGCEIKVIDDHNRISIGVEGTHYFLKDNFQYISIIPISDNVIFTSQGLKYEVNHLEIRRGDPRGISNEISKLEAIIQIHKGIALIIESKD